MSDTETDDVLGDLYEMIGVENRDELPHEKLYREFTEGKHPKMIMVQYWFKHEWYVYNSFLSQGWIVSKPSGDKRIQVSARELSRAMLRYYFQMTNQPRFTGEDAVRRGLNVDMEKFLDLVMEEPTIKKVIENPSQLV